MLGALNWTVTWFRPDGPQDAETVSRGVADFLLRGLAADRPRVGARPRCPAGPADGIRRGELTWPPTAANCA